MHCKDPVAMRGTAISARFSSNRPWSECNHYEAREIDYDLYLDTVFYITDEIYLPGGCQFNGIPYEGPKTVPWKGQYKVGPKQKDDYKC
jgi:hypothetical protein